MHDAFINFLIGSLDAHISNNYGVDKDELPVIHSSVVKAWVGH